MPDNATLRTSLAAVRAADTGGMRDTLSDERNKSERERQELATGIAALTREIDDLDDIIEQATKLRNRKKDERSDMMDAHSVKASSVAMLADRQLRSANS